VIAFGTNLLLTGDLGRFDEEVGSECFPDPHWATLLCPEGVKENDFFTSIEAPLSLDHFSFHLLISEFSLPPVCIRFLGQRRVCLRLLLFRLSLPTPR
jgi:hypothetical protein